MSAPRRFTQEDLMLYAMQLLSVEEMAEITAWLEQSEEARRELAQVQGDLVVYAHTVELHSPPAAARERLLKQVTREKKVVPIAPVEQRSQVQEQPTHGSGPEVYGATEAGRPERSGGQSHEREADHSLAGMGRGVPFGGSLSEDDQPKRNMAARALPWAGWAIAAGVAVVAGNLYHDRDALQTQLATQTTRMDHLTADAEAARQVLDALTDPAAAHVTLTKGPVTPVPQGRATYVAAKGTLIFVANNLQQLPPDKAYELWLIPNGAKSAPIPAGTFSPDMQGNASVILPPLPKGVEAKAFGVTIEDRAGATTPTLPIILAGAAGSSS